jgi:hypothetical protein
MGNWKSVREILAEEAKPWEWQLGETEQEGLWMWTEFSRFKISLVGCCGHDSDHSGTI